MAAGLIHKANIWAINYQDDDVSGGAVITGTVVHENVACRVQSQPTLQALKQQGLETDTPYTVLCVPVTLSVEERYEFELVQPSDHPFAGKRYRILDVHPADFAPADRRNYMLFSLQRSEKAHSLQ